MSRNVVDRPKSYKDAATSVPRRRGRSLSKVAYSSDQWAHNEPRRHVQIQKQDAGKWDERINQLQVQLEEIKTESIEGLRQQLVVQKEKTTVAIAELREEMTKSGGIFGVPFVRIVVGEMLKWIVKECTSSTEHNGSSLYTLSGNRDKNKIVMAIASAFDEDQGTISLKANSCIDARNSNAHYNNFNELKMGLEHATDLVKTYPSIRTACSAQAYWLDRYEVLIGKAILK